MSEITVAVSKYNFIIDVIMSQSCVSPVGRKNFHCFNLNSHRGLVTEHEKGELKTYADTAKANKGRHDDVFGTNRVPSILVPGAGVPDEFVLK